MRGRLCSQRRGCGAAAALRAFGGPGSLVPASVTSEVFRTSCFLDRRSNDLPFFRGRSIMSGFARAPVPIPGVCVVALDPVYQGVDPVVERGTLMHLTNLVRPLQFFPDPEAAGLYGIERHVKLRI